MINSGKETLTTAKKHKIELAAFENEALEKFNKRRYLEAANIILEKIVGKITEGKKEEGWYYQLSAQFSYLENKVESNNLQNKACDTTTLMFHPPSAHIYKKIKTKGLQGTNVRKFIEGFSTPQDVALYGEEIINVLKYTPDIKADRFEMALANLGTFLGFSVQMPEKELGNGPDCLWCMTDGFYLVLEAKSMAIHDEITRDNIGQLLGSEEWFKKQYPDKKEDYLAVTLQNTNKKGANVNISERTKVLDEAALQKLHKNLRLFVKSLQGKSNQGHTDDEISKLLVAYNLTPTLFIDTYLKAIKNK